MLIAFWPNGRVIYLFFRVAVRSTDQPIGVIYTHGSSLSYLA